MKQLEKLFLYPILPLLVIALVFGFIGGLVQSASLHSAIGGAALSVVLTGLFIVFPVWIVALGLSNTCMRRDISYKPFRFWIWVLPALLTAGLATYVSYLSARSSSSLQAGLNDNATSLTFPAIYLAGAIASVTLALIVGRWRLAYLTRRRKHA